MSQSPSVHLEIVPSNVQIIVVPALHRVLHYRLSRLQCQLIHFGCNRCKNQGWVSR